MISHWITFILVSFQFNLFLLLIDEKKNLTFTSTFWNSYIYLARMSSTCNIPDIWSFFLKICTVNFVWFSVLFFYFNFTINFQWTNLFSVNEFSIHFFFLCVLFLFWSETEKAKRFAKNTSKRYGLQSSTEFYDRLAYGPNLSVENAQRKHVRSCVIRNQCKANRKSSP